MIALKLTKTVLKNLNELQLRYIAKVAEIQVMETDSVDILVERLNGIKIDKEMVTPVVLKQIQPEKKEIEMPIYKKEVEVEINAKKYIVKIGEKERLTKRSDGTYNCIVKGNVLVFVVESATMVKKRQQII